MKATFTNKLKGYSALVSSFLAMNGAHAQIIYTNINPDKVLGGRIPDNFPLIDTSDLDLNNDGVYDFRAIVDIIGPSLDANGWDNKMVFYGLNTAGGGFNKVLLTYTGNSSAHVDIPYQGGMIISGLEQSFFNRGRYLVYGIGSAAAGLFLGKEAYAGVELKDAGHNYFGWVRLALNPLSNDTPRLVIKDYAFNSAPDQPILTGQRIANACADPFETKWYIGTIPSIQFGATNEALISPVGDVDTYKISVTASAPNVRAVLSNLPRNYNLRLLNSSFAVITRSAHPGLMNDTVIANNLSAGTYYLEVGAKMKRFEPDKCYSLIAESSANPYRDLGVNTENAISELHVYPNPANDLLSVASNNILDTRSKLSIYDMLGRLVLAPDNTIIDSDGSININISPLPEGSYVLHLESEKITGIAQFIVER